MKARQLALDKTMRFGVRRFPPNGARVPHRLVQPVQRPLSLIISTRWFHSTIDGLEHTLPTAHSLLQDLLLGTHFQSTSGTFTHTLLSVATWKLICLVALD